MAIKRQCKVSMVIPCYNKAPYIGNMFQSIITQKWDNIELILVNDGSNDGTRAIIAEWESKFHVRGYEVVIVDQENQGVAAAVYSGLLRISGDFVCQVDADDELDPEYVSTMAGCLEEHEEYDWCKCDFLVIPENGKTPYVIETSEEHSGKHMIENYLFFFDTSACEYVIRKSYIEKCRITKHFETTQRVTQEPQIVIPLILGGGRLKHVGMALYRYRIRSGSSITSIDTFEKRVHYQDVFCDIVVKTLKKQGLEVIETKRLVALAKIARLQQLFRTTGKYGKEYDEHRREWARATKDLIREHFVLERDFDIVDIVSEYNFFFDAFANWILNRPRKEIPARDTQNRVVACGVLGKRAERFLPLLLKTELAPTELWDISADPGVRVENIAVSKPAYEKLSKRDTVLILPSNRGAAREIRDRLTGIDIGYCLSCDDVAVYLASRKFPQFTGECIFVP